MVNPVEDHPREAGTDRGRLETIDPVRREVFPADLFYRPARDGVLFTHFNPPPPFPQPPPYHHPAAYHPSSISRLFRSLDPPNSMGI